jgi:hypothetical protein
MTKSIIAFALAAALASPAAAATYRIISLIDFKLDKAAIEQGTRIELFGQLQQLGAIAMLKSEPMDMQPIFVELKNLPRDQRKALLEKCPMICSVLIRGSVGTVFMQTGLVAEDLTVQ